MTRMEVDFFQWGLGGTWSVGAVSEGQNDVCAAAARVIMEVLAAVVVLYKYQRCGDSRNEGGSADLW